MQGATPGAGPAQGQQNGARPGPDIRLDGVSLTRAGRVVLQDLNLHLNDGRIGLIGRNGSGKSSLARLIAGLEPPSSGQLRLGGIDPARDRRGALRRVGILFQNPDHQIIFPTVGEEIAFGLQQLGQNRRAAQDSARAVLTRFGKAHWADAPNQTLSQGQRQLVCLMAVAAMGPGLLILDEPFAGLDLPTRAQLGRYFERVECALIHISHDPDDLAGYDRVLWLEEGALVADGPSDTVLAAYRAQMRKLGEGDDISDLTG